MLSRLLLAAATVLALAACGDSGSTPTASTNPNAPKQLTLAVIPKGTTHSFWKSVEAGARKAEAELNIKVIWKGPIQENDRAGQIQVVQQFVAQKVDGIVLAPLDQDALLDPVQDAAAAKIPVVIFDSALKGTVGKDFVSFVATDNKAGGALAGAHMAKLLNNKGKVVVLRYMEGSASTLDREAGFLEALAKHPDITVIASNRYGGPGAGEAQKASLDMMAQIRDADGVFASNESNSVGMLQALRAQDLAGKKKFVGFDASDTLLTGLKAGEIDALVAQNPTKMGYEAVKALVGRLRGEKVAERIDSGAALITKENLDTPDIKSILGK